MAFSLQSLLTSASEGFIRGLPTYGNYGGAGWTAGQKLTESSSNFNSTLYDANGQLNVKPVDSLDSLFLKHDIDVHNSWQNGKEVGLPRTKADYDLFFGLLKLDATQLSIEGQRYRTQAIGAFLITSAIRTVNLVRELVEGSAPTQNTAATNLSSGSATPQASTGIMTTQLAS
jgi:hypothetical protein